MAVFREPDLTAFIINVIQIKRHGKPAVGGKCCAIIAVAGEMAFFSRVVTADTQDFHASRSEVERL